MMDVRKGDLFVLSLARVGRVRRGSVSSVLLICAGGVYSILLLPLMARCLETINRRQVGRLGRIWLDSVEVDMAELEIDLGDVHDR